MQKEKASVITSYSIHYTKLYDTYYGWGEMGDRTDTSDWPDWFNDDVMAMVYGELGNMTGHNSIAAAPA